MDSTVSFNPNLITGVWEIGVLISCVLFGVSTTQTYTYYTRFPDDPAKIKALVALVWIGDVVRILCFGHTLYIYTITDFIHPERIFGLFPVSLPIGTLFDGLVGFGVQGFFAARIYTLSKKLLIPVLIWVLGFLRLVGTIGMLVTALGSDSVAIYVARWEWIFTSDFSLGVVNDVIITATLVFWFYRQRRGAHRGTVAVIDKLIVWTMETGMITSVTGITALICFIKMKTNFIWMATIIVNGSLFSNSLLASLNSRTTLRTMNEVAIPSSDLIPSSDVIPELIRYEAKVGTAIGVYFLYNHATDQK
ncbi:hypothetical protein B0H13DRAFT_2352001 [Mycena leptocephala]|nr:hypothetical protein B0H13DRAFT_2352001 [Mycena leptocephala]